MKQLLAILGFGAIAYYFMRRYNESQGFPEFDWNPTRLVKTGSIPSSGADVFKTASAKVNTAGLQPTILAALGVVKSIFSLLGAGDLVVTSGQDSTHMTGSKHYTGEAVDIRSHSIPRSLLASVVSAIKRELAGGYDVVLEDEGKPNEHIHIEYDPKGSYSFWS